MKPLASGRALSPSSRPCYLLHKSIQTYSVAYENTSEGTVIYGTLLVNGPGINRDTKVPEPENTTVRDEILAALTQNGWAVFDPEQPVEMEPSELNALFPPE
jgi:hypothetical protein